MSVYTIRVTPGKINFHPSSTLEEILQNVNTIVSTIMGTVPLSRKFGVQGEFIDDPTPVSKIKFIAEIKDKVEEYEPRARVTEVRYGPESLDGIVNPIVTIEVNEGVIL